MRRKSKSSSIFTCSTSTDITYPLQRIVSESLTSWKREEIKNIKWRNTQKLWNLTAKHWVCVLIKYLLFYSHGLFAFSFLTDVQPENPALYGNRSACYMMLGQYFKALEDARKAISLDDKFVKVFITFLAAYHFWWTFELFVISFRVTSEWSNVAYLWVKFSKPIKISK